MACNVEANGATFTCACSGCGIAYNHDTKKYHILCCGSITEMSLKNPIDDPADPPRPGHVDVSLSQVTLLDAALLLDRAVPGGRLTVKGPLRRLRKRVTLKANQPLKPLAEQLGLDRA